MTEKNPFMSLIERTKAEMAAKAAKTQSASAQIEVPAPMPTQPHVKIESPKVEMQSNPFLAPASMTLAGPVEDEIEDTSFSNVDDGVYSVGELARINTEQMNMKPQVDRVQKSEVVQAQRLTRAAILGSNDDVRALCDKVDSLLESIDVIRGPSLVELRSYVQVLMITLKEHPEFDSVLIDKDVHNIMRFVQATSREAEDHREIKTAKKAVRVAKKASKASEDKMAGLMANAFNSLFNTKP